ncbi:CCA tRNA nucleotidyltransferase [candidate division WOR-3 bacterium]|nr:CCA tRNA nucleotidyltransferase [candidate division WOR-3 bacterium]
MARSKYSAKKKKKSVSRKVIDFFAGSEHRAYLVGGYVRDSTLGRESIDIDVVVEGDGISAARKLNAVLKGKIVSHPDFGTASIDIDGYRVDIASARTEKYPSPAHLPHVYPSTIVEDLNRRDFTINAIAMSISRTNFGEIFDPFDGLSDIKHKLVRVLHRGSFIDDPTRIFRALRYKNRFQFKLEDETERLMREAVKAGMIMKLSGPRILNEVALVFAEETYAEIVSDLIHYGILTLKRRDLRLMPSTSELAFYFLLSKLPRNMLPLTREMKKVVDGFRKIEDTMDKLHRSGTKSKIYNALSPVAEEVIEAMPIVNPQLSDKTKIFHNLRHVKPFITGKDLKKYGFKPENMYSKILHSVFLLQLDKKLKSRRDALAYLKNLSKN